MQKEIEDASWESMRLEKEIAKMNDKLLQKCVGRRGAEGERRWGSGRADAGRSAAGAGGAESDPKSRRPPRRAPTSDANRALWPHGAPGARGHRWAGVDGGERSGGCVAPD